MSEVKRYTQKGIYNMKQIKKLAEDVNYTAIDLEDLNDLMKYSLIYPVNK